MKKGNIIIWLLFLCFIAIIVNCILLYKVLNTNKYDVNCDGIVNSKDMLDLRLYLISQE